MKKINSIGYGGRIAAAAGLFLIAIPACLLVLNALTLVPAYKTFAYISLAIGGCIAVFLILLLIIEGKQDKKWNAFYRKQRNTKASLGSGRYECQACGSRDVYAHDTVCRVCGIRFINANNIET